MDSSEICLLDLSWKQVLTYVASAESSYWSGEEYENNSAGEEEGETVFEQRHL